MELDNLKQSWQQSETKKIKNTDIMELIHHKSYGPIAALKQNLRKQIRLMMVLPVILIATNLQNIDAVLTSVLFWSYVAFCVGVVIYSSYNYRIVKKMEDMDGQVKTNLQKQIALLEARVQRNVIGLRIVALYFILLLEVLPYLQHFRMLDKWHALSPFIRFGTYAAFLLFQYFMSRRISKIKFGNHIAHLKTLVKEME